MKKTGIRIFARAGDLGERSDQAWNALIKANDPPELFMLGDVMVRIELKGGEAKTAALEVTKMRHALVRAADFITRGVNDTGKVKKSCPTRDLVEDVLAHPAPELPPLDRITEVPIVAADGSIQTKPGYHAASRTLYAPAKGFKVADVSEHPRAEDMEQARAIVFEMLGEFPFVAFSDLAHALALLLLPVARELIEGPTPIHVLEKPTPGTGAGLLALCLTYPAIGRSLPMGVEADNAELRKRITATLLEGPIYFVLDNMHNALTSAAISSVVTALTWTDRFLARTRNVTVPVRCIFITTGNNPSATIDNARRMIRIRIDAGVERPDLRSGFKIPDLIGWVHKHRAQVVHAMLTIVKAWIAAGRPAGRNAVLGSFEQWSRTIGGILEVARIPGFLGNVEDYHKEIAENEATPEFIEAWWRRYESEPVTALDLTTILVDSGISARDLARESGRFPERDATDASVLGLLLRGWRDRVISGHAIGRAGKDRKGKALWALLPPRGGNGRDSAGGAGGQYSSYDFSGNSHDKGSGPAPPADDPPEVDRALSILGGTRRR